MGVVTISTSVQIDQIVLLVTMTAVPLWSSWALAALCVPADDHLKRLLATYVIALSYIVVVLETLGVLGLISAANAILGTLPMAAAAIVSLKSVKHWKSPQGSPVRRKAILPSAMIAVVVLAPIAAFALVMPPAPTDAFLDHLVFPAEWLKAGKLFFVNTLSPDQATTYYPADAELLYLWLMLPFHNDVMTGMVEVMSLAVCAVAAYCVAIRLGAGKAAASGAASASVVMPGVALLSQQFGVDLYYSAAFLTAVAMLLPEGDGHDVTWQAVLIAGCAAGLAAGAKFVGVIFAVLLIPLVLSAGRVRLRYVSLFVCAALVTGGYWYFRNLVATGSPFYPLGLSIGSIQFFDGAYDKSAMYASYLHIDTRDFGYLYKIFTDNLVGVTGLYAVACVTLISLFAAKRGNLQFVRGYTLLLGPVIVLMYWYVNPYNTANNARFMVPGLFLCMMIPAVLGRSDRMKYLWPPVVLGVAWGNLESLKRCAAWLAVAADDRVAMMTALYSVIVVAMALIAFFAQNGQKFYQIGGFIALILSLCLLAEAKSGYMQQTRYQWYGGHYLGAGWAALSTITDEVTIAYSGNCAPYGLYGEGLKNHIVYVNIDGKTDVPFHVYEKRLRNGDHIYTKPAESVWLNEIFRNGGSYGAWRNGLAKQKVDLLFVTRELYRGRPRAPVELDWAATHPEDFRLLFNRGDTFIYAVRKQ